MYFLLLLDPEPKGCALLPMSFEVVDNSSNHKSQPLTMVIA
jgi:hypothetical protein